MSQLYPQYTNNPNQQFQPDHGVVTNPPFNPQNPQLPLTNGDLDAIIANGNGGNQVITIKKTDKAFETRGCGAWTRIG